MSMPSIDDFGPMTPPDDDDGPYKTWMRWFAEDLEKEGHHLLMNELCDLGDPLYEAGMSARSAALKITEKLDEEDGL